MNDTAWLIEKEGTQLCLGVQCKKFAWVTANQAIRFAREEDAASVIPATGSDSCRPVEHQWAESEELGE